MDRNRTSATTRFDVDTHGFGFRNRFAGSQVVSELATQGRLDSIVGVGVPEPIRAVLGLADRAEFFGTFGLCGGMSWSALDSFRESRTSDQSDQPPTRGATLFSALVSRQADSFANGRLVATLGTWIALPTANRWWSFWMDSIGKRVVKREWPALKASLDAGLPRGLCLIRSKRPEQIARNHQVVAIGYSTDPDGRVALSLYDPNHPGQSPTITFNTRSFLHDLEIVQSSREPLVGWFVWPPIDVGE